MPSIIGGPRTWGMERDEQGHREYKVRWLILADSIDDGPANILQTPGLPQPGDTWAYGGDIDIWAWCRPTTSVKIHMEKEGDPNVWWTVEQTFSTKPPDRDQTREQSTKIEDPLSEPIKISGGVTKYTEEGLLDAFGRIITNSSWELIRGPQNEWDYNRPSIQIERNVARLDLAICTAAVDCVNSEPMWGLPRRQVKLSDFSWDRKFTGRNTPYYTHKFTFDVNPRSWDRDILDEGTKVLRGQWNNAGEWELVDINGVEPQQSNPLHFMRAIDRQGNPCKVILDGRGRPYDAAAGVLSKFLDDGWQYVGDIVWSQRMFPPVTSTATIGSPTGVTCTAKEGGGIYQNAPSIPFFPGLVNPLDWVYAVTALQENGAETRVQPITGIGTASISPAGTPNGSILVEWTAVPGAVGYRIYACPAAVLSPYSTLDIGVVAAATKKLYKIYERSGRVGTRKIVKYRQLDFLTTLGLPTQLE